MAAERDPGDDERYREVQDDEPERLAAEDVDLPPLEHQRRAHDSPDCPRSAHGERVRRPEERAGGACEPRDEVEERVPAVAQVLLERRADEPEHEHVHSEVEEAVVEERGGDQPPPLALADADQLTGRVERAGDEDAVLVDPAGVRVQAGTHGELEDVDTDVDRDQGLGDVRAAQLERPARAPRRALRRHRAPARARVVGAANADRAERHAVGADPAPALGTRHVGLPVRVPITAERLGHRG